MSNSEAVAVVQGMLAQQRKQDAAEWAAYQEARRKEAQQEKKRCRNCSGSWIWIAPKSPWLWLAWYLP